MKKKIMAILKEVFVYVVENLLIIFGMVFLFQEKLTTAFIAAVFAIPLSIYNASKRIERKIDTDSIVLDASIKVTKNIVEIMKDASGDKSK